MKARISIAILWIIWTRLANEAAAANSGERVHIRLHMPEVVRQHTYFHKVFKPLSVAAAPPPPQPSHYAPPAPPQLSKLMPLGKPHVSLLGYTTTASGTGGMAPSLRQLMATAAAPMSMPMPAMPTLTPNYGPALFDSYNQQAEAALREATAPDAVKPSGSYLPTALSTSTSSKQQQLLQQLLTPNLMAAVRAAQQQLEEEKQQQQLDADIEFQPELELEHNELLNGNFLAALQREYLAKFGRQRNKKKVNFVSRSRKKPQKQSNYVQEAQFDEFQEGPGTGYDEADQESLEQQKFWGDSSEVQDDARGYDSAVAFSGQNNAISALPSVDEFMNEVNGKSFAPFHSNMYDDYGTSDTTGSNTWQASPTFNSYGRPTKTTPTRLQTRHRRPSTESISGPSSTENAAKVRYIKLTTRKKRKNRIKAKRYRI